jgi:RNA polymerase sigma-70 factor (ECF subfamily)
MNAVMTMLAEDSIPTRYSLLSRMQDREDQDSWKDFFDTYWRLIYSFAIKSGLTDAEAQDVVQETVISVARDIQKFKRDRTLGSFKGWLRNLTRWRIADQFRKRTRSVPAENNLSTPSPSPDEAAGPVNADLEAIWEQDWQANLLEAAMERVKPRVKEEHYQMFDLNVVRQWPASKVAQTFGVNIGRVYLAKYRIMALIKKEIRVLEKQW